MATQHDTAAYLAARYRIVAPTAADKRSRFDTAYTAHAVCKCGHEQGIPRWHALQRRL